MDPTNETRAVVEREFGTLTAEQARDQIHLFRADRNFVAKLTSSDHIAHPLAVETWRFLHEKAHGTTPIND